MTSVCNKEKANWKPLKTLQEKYSISHGLAYKLSQLQGFPKIYVGKTIRVDMNKIEEFIYNYFN